MKRLSAVAALVALALLGSVSAGATTTPPAQASTTASFTAPTDGARLSGTAVRLTVQDEPNAYDVPYVYLDGVLLKEAYDYDSYDAGAYTWLWDTTSTSNGTHQLTAGTSAGPTGPTIAVNVQNIVPTVVVTAPTGGSTVSGRVSFKASATADPASGASIQRVELYAGEQLLGTDFTAPYQLDYDTGGLSDGAQRVSAKAFDTVGLQAASAPVTVTVKNGVDLAIVSPRDGQTVTGTQVPLQVRAASSGDDPPTVFLDGIRIAGGYADYDSFDSTTNTYTYLWDSTQVGNGRRQLSASSDEQPSAQRPLTDPITITVDNSGPVTDQPGTKRLAGADRYATAAAIVRDSFPAGPVPVVFIATGEAFADALAGGPAADVLGGPVLPVAKNGVPAVIRTEVDRLDPARIVVLGGAGAISDATVAELAGYTTGTVTRLAGVNRYDTAAKVALSTFDGPVSQVLIATGTGFADALAGGPVGARTGTPVLLVDPVRLPAETAQALRALQPANIAVLGGTSVVSDAVLNHLKQYTTGGVTRLAGANRYATAAKIVSWYWTQPTPVVYLATGRNFPDALAGVPAAGRDGAPLLLVEPDCMPAETAAQMDRLDPQTVVVLGGTATVSDAAASGRPCPIPPGSACSPTAPLFSHEDSGICLYRAFVKGDVAMARNYATPAVADEFLSWREGTVDPGWSWEGCTTEPVGYPSSGIGCGWYADDPGAPHGVYIEFQMGRDFRAEAIETIG